MIMRKTLEGIGTLLLYFLIFGMISTVSTKDANYTKAFLKSCSGWRLNKLPKVKEFILSDAPNFDLKVDFVGGDPRLVFLDHEEKQIEEINVVKYDKYGIAFLLEERGFFRKDGPFDDGIWEC